MAGSKPLTATTAARAARRRLTAAAIVAAALDVLDRDGVDALTTTSVARRLGVTQPALYSHIASLEQLQREVAAHGASELSELVSSAVGDMAGETDPALALRAMARAYRDYVRRHPDRYLLQLSAPRDPAYLEATERSAEAVRAVLRRFGLTESQVKESHVAFRAAVHGFVHLEARAALAADPGHADAHFEFFVELFAAGLRALSGERSPRG